LISLINEKLRFGVFLGEISIEEAVRQSIIAEESQIDTIWYPDIFSYTYEDPDSGPDVWMALAIVAEKTKSVRLGPMVTDIDRRHPAITAQCVITLDHISNGRAVLGIGSGVPMILAPIGIEWDVGLTRMREALSLIRKLFDSSPGELVNFKGKYYNLSNAYTRITPKQNHIPIYLGSMLGKKMRGLAGEMADAWLPYTFPAESFASAVQDVRTSAKQANRKEKVGSCAFINIAFSDSKEARDKALLGFKAELALLPELLKPLGYDLEKEQPKKFHEIIFTLEDVKRLQDLGRKIPDNIVMKFAATNPDDCVSLIEDYVSAGATEIVFHNRGPDFDQNYNILNSKVLPHFK
jgi:alkanesulfonate monooxygenase SsuD/methylene tetrahydromethanopterin reductase-like flavin-dependent oxidoreductase (luciferase family)